MSSGTLTVTMVDRHTGTITMSSQAVQLSPGDYLFRAGDFVTEFEHGMQLIVSARGPDPVPLTWWGVFFAWLAWLVAVQASNGDAMKRREFFRALLPGALDAAKDTKQ